VPGAGTNRNAWKWTAKKEAVALALAEGKSIREAAASCDVAVSSVAEWKKAFEFQQRIDEHHEEIIKEARRVLKRNAVEAAKTIVKHFKSTSRDDAVSLQAAKDVLDRVGLKLPEQIDLTGKLDMKHSADDEQLDSYLAAVAQISAAKAVPGRTDNDVA
jgi:transposase